MGKSSNRQGVHPLEQRITKLQLVVASLREEIVLLQVENAALRTENARLRQELATLGGDGDDGTGTASGSAPERNRPGSWGKANVVVVERHKPRQGRALVPGWHRQEPDRQVIHAIEVCTGCGATLRRGEVVQRRQLMVLPPVEVEVVEHVVLQRRCRQCGMVNRGQMPDLSDIVGVNRRFGWDIVAEVAVLRTKLRVPLASLQWLLHHVWGLRISEGALCGCLDDAAQAGKAAYDGVLADARASPAMHVDETGWRQNGHNGFIWTVSTDRERYLHFNQHRAGRVMLRLVGEDYPGVVVSDFYAAYNQFDGLHQRCWAHLLRDIHALRSDYPDDGGLTVWAEAMQSLYHRSSAWVAQPTPRTPHEREATRRTLEAEALALCQAQPANAPQTTLCARVVRYLPELFMFVAVPAADATNNAAERALRPLVIARKISGGSRSAKGTKTRMVLQSLIDTWTLRQEDPVQNMRSLLQSQHTPATQLASV